jgi:hypothetical protein
VICGTGSDIGVRVDLQVEIAALSTPGWRGLGGYTDAKQFQHKGCTTGK